MYPLNVESSCSSGTVWKFSGSAPISATFFGELQHLFADFSQDRAVSPLVQYFGDPPADLPHLGLLHAACGQGGCADANAARLHRRIRIERNRILIDGNAGFSERLFGLAAEHTFRKYIN